MDTQKLKGRKLIKCPYCSEHLIDVGRNTLVKVYRTPKGKGLKPIPNQRSKECPACKSIVGFVMSKSQEEDVLEHHKA